MAKVHQQKNQFAHQSLKKKIDFQGQQDQQDIVEKEKSIVPHNSKLSFVQQMNYDHLVPLCYYKSKRSFIAKREKYNENPKNFILIEENTPFCLIAKEQLSTIYNQIQLEIMYNKERLFADLHADWLSFFSLADTNDFKSKIKPEQVPEALKPVYKFQDELQDTFKSMSTHSVFDTDEAQEYDGKMPNVRCALTC